MAVAQERRVSVLAALCACGADQTAVALSFKTIAADTGLSCSQVRSALRALKKAGYVQSVPRRLSNGGTAENAYRVTSEGRNCLCMYLRSFDEAR